MTLLVVGLSHRSAPVPLLERASIGTDEVPKVLHELLGGPHVAEVMVLSTCNRVEVYADVERFHGGLTDVSTVLARQAGVDLSALANHLYVHYEDAAVEHLFEVAAGLDSMVVGESQILGQLRAGYQVAVETDAIGRLLHELFQRALRAGKRVRTETGIDSAGASLVSVALAEAERFLGSLVGRPALIVGAGSMGALAAATLRRAAIGELVVVNRTPGKAERLAATVDGRGAGMDELPALVGTADVIVASTGASGIVLGYDVVERAVAARGGQPLAILDLALPRDVDAAVAGLPTVSYVDLAVLGDRLAGSQHAADVDAARQIVLTEVASYLAAQRAGQVGPTVTALRARAAEVVDAELVRLDQKLPGLNDAVRDELGRTVRRVVNTLLHAPTVRVKQLAEAPGGDVYATALRELFGLDPAAPKAVSTPSVALPEEFPQ
ncbi:MAG TPA: glutamyl-tRNA reductase [Mycobacteriales bacterium]|nr:glutamyl-tRNA reductase [Mycobacteriales bacterium]